MACSKGEEYSIGQCWKSCPVGYTGVGPQCMRSCPPGFKDAQTMCLKPVLDRGAPIAPSLLACAANQRDDGLNCWDTLECSYVPGATAFQLTCTGTNAMSVPFQNRQSCPPGYVLFENMCYVACPTGYEAVGSLCAKTCPTGYPDMASANGLPGLQCAKSSVTREPGHPLLNGLARITSDPRKSTLVQRYSVMSTTTEVIGSAGLQSLSDSFDPISCIGDLIQFLTGGALIQLLKWIALIGIIFFGFPLLKPFVDIIGSTLSPVGKGVGTAAGKLVESAATVTTDQINALGSVLAKSTASELAP